MMPGDPELAVQSRRLVEGIPLDAALWADMCDWSARLKLASPVATSNPS
jgi:ureidoglycolate dehydrogenase (NAD+)